MNPSTQNVAPLSSFEKALAVLEYRRAGHTYAAIAHLVGLSKARVGQIVKREMLKLDKAMAQEAKILRQLDLQRLDEMWVKIYEKAKEGDTQAIHAAMKIIERRAKICGYEQMAEDLRELSAEEFSPMLLVVGEPPTE